MDKAVSEWILDGYAAISPTGKVSELSLSRSTIEDRMTRIVDSDFLEYEAFVIATETERNKMFEEGWKIVPVKITIPRPQI